MTRYGDFGRDHPIHLGRFFDLQRRAKSVGTDLSFDLEGFRRFVSIIGPIPSSMLRPSVGRCNHSLGYVEGNYEWQEFEENCRESAVRGHLGGALVGDALERIKASKTGVALEPRSDETKKKISDALLGHKAPALADLNKSRAGKSSDSDHKDKISRGVKGYFEGLDPELVTDMMKFRAMRRTVKWDRYFSRWV